MSGTMSGRRLVLPATMGVCLFCAATAAPALAEEAEVESVVVTGKAPTKNAVSSAPEALPAATTVVTEEELARRPVTRYTDLLRPVAGVQISNFQPGGLAVGISMRGYSNGNHGRDVARIVDGMPLGTTGNIGAADLNWILPEAISRIEVVRGPFSAEYGEDALGGVVNIVTKDADPTPVAGIQAGTYGSFRGYGSYSRGQAPSGGFTPYLAAETYSTDGWWDNSEYRRQNFMAKGSKDYSEGRLSMRLQGATSEWGSPNYFPVAAYKNGAVAKDAAVSERDGGSSDVAMAVVNWRPHDPDNGLSVSGYAYHNEFTRYMTTYATQLQSATQDKRTTVGGTIKRSWTGDVYGLPAQLLVGSDLRGDTGATSSGRTVNRALQSFTYNLDYDRYLMAGFVQTQIKPVSWLKLTGGARYDRAYYSIDNHMAGGLSSNQDGEVWSPKGGVTVTPVEGLDLFANYGEGFRLPNITTELRTNPSVAPQKVKSKEVGFETHLPASSTLRVSLWHTRQDNELQTINNVTRNIGDSRRKGFDIEGRTFLMKEEDRTLDIYASYTRTIAELVDRAPALYVTDVPRTIATLGVEGERRLGNGDSFGGALNVQANGQKWATETGTMHTKPYALAQGRVYWGFNDTLTLFTEASWLLGDRYSELGSTTILAQPRFNGLVGVTYRFN